MSSEELIYKYFLGELNAEELKEFNVLLKNDPEFNEQVNFEIKVKNAIRQTEYNKLKGKLNDIEGDIKKKSLNSILFTKPWAIAASLLLFFSIAFYFFINSLSNDIEELYNLNYEKYPNTVYSIQRSGSDENSLERKAFEAYESNNDSKAIELLNDLKKENDADFIDFYLAQSYLNNNQLNKAIPVLKNIIVSGGKFKEESQWYLALAYLKMDDIKSAISQLNIIIEKNEYKKEEAKILLTKLN